MNRTLVRVSALISLLFSTLTFAVIQNGSCPEPLRLPADGLTVTPGILRVGMQVDLDPVNGFNFTDPATGRIDGKDVRVACAFAQCIGAELQIVNLPFGELIPAVRTGGIDPILAQQNRTEERLQVIEQIPYGGIQDLTLTFRSPAPSGLSSGTDLLVAINNASGISNKSIGVIAGSIQETVLDQTIAAGNANLRKVIVTNSQEALAQVSSGAIIAFFFEGFTVDPNDPAFTQLVTTTPLFTFQPISAGVRRDNCTLINAFWNWARLNVDLLAQLSEQFTPAYRFDASQVTSFTPQVCQLSQFNPCRFGNCPWAQAIFNKFCALTGLCEFTVVNLSTVS
jgi:ABC-type amino acid transport substrate-binding protein